MSSLLQTDPLKIYPQSPEPEVIVTHPGIGRKLDCYQSEYRFNLYLHREDFIKATDNFQQITLKQLNDCEPQTLLVKNEIRKELGNPGQVKMFRKNDNIFLLPV